MLSVYIIQNSVFRIHWGKKELLDDAIEISKNVYKISDKLDKIEVSFYYFDYDNLNDILSKIIECKDISNELKIKIFDKIKFHFGKIPKEFENKLIEKFPENFI